MLSDFTVSVVAVVSGLCVFAESDLTDGRMVADTLLRHSALHGIGPSFMDDAPIRGNGSLFT